MPYRLASLQNFLLPLGLLPRSSSFGWTGCTFDLLQTFLAGEQSMTPAGQTAEDRSRRSSNRSGSGWCQPLVALSSPAFYFSFSPSGTSWRCTAPRQAPPLVEWQQWPTSVRITHESVRVRKCQCAVGQCVLAAFLSVIRTGDAPEASRQQQLLADPPICDQQCVPAAVIVKQLHS